MTCWYNGWSNTLVTDVEYPSFTTGIWHDVYTYATHAGGHFEMNSQGQVIRVSLDPVKDAAVTIDQGLQTYTSQPWGVSSGWPDPSTGHCLTLLCEAYNTGPSSPQLLESAAQTVGDGLSDVETGQVYYGDADDYSVVFKARW